MRVGSVELPDELVEAHAEGRLVLFVGAGASVAAPTGLPNYRELAAKVADQSERPVCGASLDRPDMVLSTLKSEGVDVHARVHGLIDDPQDRPAPEPNKLHEAIVSLGAASPQVRIVTTNYDRCLSDCLPEGIDEYEAVALPEGDEFTGLVYLHGSVRLRSERLIVTGDDLGRHYLVNHGAARFLESMFRNLSVLFIGYSLNDTLMDYLVRGLSSDRIYVLTDKPQASRWNVFGITAVGYERHDQLPGIVQDWADLSRMSMLDHQERVRRIVAGSLPLTPGDDSYLHGIVSDTHRRGLFTSEARGLDWLHWIISKPPFKELLDPFAPPERIDFGLAQWFAEHYAANTDCTTEALRLIVNAGGTLSSQLWMTITRYLVLQSRTRSEAMNRWLPILVETMPSSRRQDHILLLQLLLEGCDLERDRAAVLLALDKVLEPTLEMRRDQGARVVVPLCSNSSAEQWFNEIEPYFGKFAIELMPIVDRHIRRVDALQRGIASHSAEYDSALGRLISEVKRDVLGVIPDEDYEFFDRISSRRNAIESHPRNRLPCGVDLLIDAAREVLGSLIELHSRIADRYLESWSGAESALLRRLSVHGWCERTDATADKKLKWLMNGEWLRDRDAHHEAMRLIAKAVPSASEDALAALIEDASSDSIGQRQLRILGWIAQHAPQSIAAQQAFQEARTAHPQWTMPDDADFRTSEGWSGFIPRIPIPEAPELHELIEREPSQAVALLQKYIDADDWEAPGWSSAIDALRATTEEHPDDGIGLLEVITDDTEIDAAASQSIAETVLGVLSHLDYSSGQLDRLQTVLQNLWKTGLERFDPESHVVSPSRWLDAAINHWAGMLTELWISIVAAQWQSAGETWEGLSQVTSTAMKELLDSDSKPSHYAQAVIANNAAFLYAADKTWSQDNVLHRFDSERQPLQAFRFWDGLLGSCQLSDDLLQAGLFDYFIGFSYLLDDPEMGMDDRDEPIRSSYLNMAAAICLGSQVNLFENGWLMKWIARIDPDGRCEWARNVAFILSEISADAADVHWSRWMKSYWHNRADSIPLALTPEESSAMAEWTVLLGAGFAEAVEMAVSTGASFVKDSRIPSVLLNHAVADEDHFRPDHIALEPLVVRDLFAHLLANSETAVDDDGPWNITDAVERLDRALDQDEMKPILNELLRLGHERFVSWLQSRDQTHQDLSSPEGSPPG